MDNPTVFPVVRWGTSVAPQHQVGLLRLAFLTAPGQTKDQAQETPIYGFSAAQLRALANTLVGIADQLEGSSPSFVDFGN